MLHRINPPFNLLHFDLKLKYVTYYIELIHLLITVPWIISLSGVANSKEDKLGPLGPLTPSLSLSRNFSLI